MKKFFGYIVVLAVILFAFSSCSQNAGLSGGNIKPGSAGDPFANTSWYLHAGGTSSKLIEFQSSGKFVYGTSYGGYGGSEIKGNYSVQKNGDEYVASCVISSGGQSGVITLEIDDFSSSSGILRIETVYYNVYSY